MNLTVVHSPGARPLHDLEQFVEQQEAMLGPLVDLGNASTETALTFNLDADAPGQPIILRLTIGGQSPTVMGHTLVCQGNCIVAGQLAGVAALRASSTQVAVAPGRAKVAANALVSAPVSAMEQALTSELSTALSFKTLIVHAATAKGLPPAVLAGIGSHESAWGTHPLMSPNGPGGTGDRNPRSPRPPRRPGSMPVDGLGFGRGLMQIDWDAHEFARTGAWQDPKANIEFGCGVLADAHDRFARTMSGDDAVTAAIAAYNAGFKGASNAITARTLAIATGPGTYTSKVLPRVRFYIAHGF